MSTRRVYRRCNLSTFRRQVSQSSFTVRGHLSQPFLPHDGRRCKRPYRHATSDNLVVPILQTTVTSLLSISVHCLDFTDLTPHFDTLTIVKGTQRLLDAGSGGEKAKLKIENSKVGHMQLEIRNEGIGTVGKGLKAISSYLAFGGHESNWYYLSENFKVRGSPGAGLKSGLGQIWLGLPTLPGCVLVDTSNVPISNPKGFRNKLAFDEQLPPRVKASWLQTIDNTPFHSSRHPAALRCCTNSRIRVPAAPASAQGRSRTENADREP